MTMFKLLANSPDVHEILVRRALNQTRAGHDSFGNFIPAYEAVYDALGMSDSQKNSRHLPKVDTRVVVDGIQWELSGPPLEYMPKHRGRRHRLFVGCPVCHNMIPGGRLHQHIKVHGIDPFLRKVNHGK